jgi:hypothetical protein
MYSRNIIKSVTKIITYFFVIWITALNNITENDAFFYLTMSLGTNRFILSATVKASKG